MGRTIDLGPTSAIPWEGCPEAQAVRVGGDLHGATGHRQDPHPTPTKVPLKKATCLGGAL